MPPDYGSPRVVGSNIDVRRATRSAWTSPIVHPSAPRSSNRSAHRVSRNTVAAGLRLETRPDRRQAAYAERVPQPAISRTAAFFDLDKTIIAKSSTLAFSRPFYEGGLINRRTVLRSGYSQFVYLVGGADHDQMERMRQYLSGLASGWDVQTVKDIVAETLHHIVDPLVFDEAVRLIEEHHTAGRDVVIVSSSGAEVVEPIGEMLGADRVIATEMVIEDGRYTGDIAFYAYGENKAEAMRALAARDGYDLERSYAYSDSATDQPMLEAVGHPHAVNPDKALRKVAVERGWPVLDFNRPVELRKRVRMPASRTALAGAALGAGALAASAVVIASRRRSRG
jgi:HAD superfamily hydrolase (TIGR01490 family)